MPNGPSHAVLRFIRKIVVAEGAGDTDGQLLGRFITHNDETAFAALVQRHGPLVLGVCRRVLNQPEDAEDVFQATFLVLARKADSIRKLESLDSWLYGVANRLARRARADAARRHVLERQAPEWSAADPMHEIVWRDVRPVLDEEICGLPEKYRLPFIWCYLEGQSNEEVAQRLDCPLGTVWSRLARARQLLQTRLTRRGLTLCGGLLATFVTENTGSAAVPAMLAETTVKAASWCAAGKAITPAIVSAQVVALTEGALKSMFLTKWIVTILFLVGGIFGAGAGVCTYRALATEPAEVKDEPLPQPLTKEAEEPKKPAKDAPEAKTYEKQSVPGQRDGILIMLGTEIKEGEQVPPERIITVKVGDEVKKYRRLRKGDKVEPGQLLGRLDDRLARDEMAIKQAKLKASEAELVSCEKTRDEAEQRYLTITKLKAAGKASVADEEVRGAKLTWDRYIFEAVAKKETVNAAKLEVKQAQTVVEMHEIRSSIRGVIKAIHKGPGEAVKSLEAVVEIQGTELID